MYMILPKVLKLLPLPVIEELKDAVIVSVTPKTALTLLKIPFVFGKTDKWSERVWNTKGAPYRS